MLTSVLDFLLFLQVKMESAVKSTLQRCLFHLYNLILLHQILNILVIDIEYNMKINKAFSLIILCELLAVV